MWEGFCRICSIMATRRPPARGRGRAAQQAQHSTALAPTIAGAGIVIGLTLTIGLHLPGVVLTWLAFTVAAWLHPSVELTGKKDSNGFPTAAHAGETRALRKYRFWSDLKWRMFSPNPDWLPGWPVFASTLLALLVAGAVAHLDDFAAPVSAFFGYVLVAQVAAARRRNSTMGEPCPGTRFGNIKSFPSDLLGFGWRVLAGFAGGAAIVYALSYVPYLTYLRDDVMMALLAAAIGATIMVMPWWANLSIGHWRVVVKAREEWKPRWEMLKQGDNAPTLIDRNEVGPFIVDMFDAPGSIGAEFFYTMGPKILPTIGTNTQVYVLPVENTDADGQPIPQSKHPLRFRIVTTTNDGMPDMTDPNLDPEVARMAFEVAIVGNCITMGAATPFIGDVQMITDTSTPKPDAAGAAPGSDMDDEEFEARLAGLPADIAEEIRAERAAAMQMSAPAEAPAAAPVYAAWMVEVQTPFGPPLKWMHEDLEGAVAGSLGCEVTFDFRNYGRCFAGALSGNSFVNVNQSAPPSTQIGSVEEALHRVAVEDEWQVRWRNALKTNVNFPVVSHEQYEEMQLRDGTTIYSQAFVTLRGDDVVGTYFGLEDKLKTALEHIPFLSTCGFLAGGARRGERHPQAFTVLWSEKAVPANPDKLQPPLQAGTRPKAQHAVLRGRVNEAFKAARLAQPEVADVTCLTTPRSRGHIWRMRVRLYGGVTLADVRGASQRLKQAWASDWLRVTETPNGDGVFIVAGANPARVTPTDETVHAELVSLDWEQAWLDAKISGVGGLTPKLTKVDALPDNQKVQVLDFNLPSGLSIEEVRQAKKKLMATTSNAFIDIRPHPDNNPANIRLLACVESPMPYPVSYDFEYTDAVDKLIPFATGIEGRPITIDVTSSPHLLLLGLSGSGKLSALDARIPVPVSERFPDGWALNRDLRVGDKVFAVDGSLTTVTGFSRMVSQPNHRVRFKDGQVAEVGPDHLWAVSDVVTRSMQTEKFTSVRDERRAKGEALAGSLNEMAASVGSGTVASLTDIAGLLGYEVKEALYQKLARYNIDHLAVFAQKQTNKKARVVEVQPVVEWLSGRVESSKRGFITVAHNRVESVHVDDLSRSAKAADGWLTVRAIADALLGREATRDERHAVGQIVRRIQPASKDGFATMTCRLFPVDEILRLLAKHEQAIASGKTEHAPLTSLVTTAELKTRFDSGYTRSPGVPVPSAIDLPEADLPVAPYTFGVWLGDGARHSAGIVSEDPEIVAGVVADGFPLRRSENHGNGNADTYFFDGLNAAIKSVYGLTPSGVVPEKVIPAVYLRGSVDQRLAVLQGLMDTDGTISKNGTCELSVTDRRLAEGALELIRSLGIKASCSWDQPAGYRDSDGNRVDCKPRHRIHFTTTAPVFRLPRKAARLPEKTRGSQDWNFIDSIEVVGEKEMRCIKVDHPDHLFLVEQFIPTHNSVSAQNLMYGALVQGYQVAMIDIQKQGADFKFAEDRCISFARDVPEAVATMEAVYDEVKRRAKISGALGKGHVREWDEPPPPIIVFIDEFKGVLMAGKKPSTKPEENPDLEKARLEAMRTYESKKRIGFLAGRLAAEARSADVHLFLMTQKLLSDDLDGDIKDLKTNLARILLGKANFGERSSALRDAQNAPDIGEFVPKGRGLWESVEDIAEVIQFWYAGSDDYRQNLVARVPEVTEAERLDLTPYLPKEVELTDMPFSVVERPFTPVVAEEVNLELDLDLSDLDDGSDEEVDLSALGIEIIDDDEDEEDDVPAATGGDLDWGDDLTSDEQQSGPVPLGDDALFDDLYLPSLDSEPASAEVDDPFEAAPDLPEIPSLDDAQIPSLFEETVSVPAEPVAAPAVPVWEIPEMPQVVEPEPVVEEVTAPVVEVAPVAPEPFVIPEVPAEPVVETPPAVEEAPVEEEPEPEVHVDDPVALALALAFGDDRDEDYGPAGVVDLPDLVDMFETGDSMFGWIVADRLLEVLNDSPRITTVVAVDEMLNEKVHGDVSRADLLESICTSVGVKFSYSGHLIAEWAVQFPQDLDEWRETEPATEPKIIPVAPPPPENLSDF